MATITTDNINYTAIANAIRSKNGTENKYKPSEMANAISNIKNNSFAETQTYSQLNPVVSQYLSEVTYDPSNYSVSLVDDYASQITTYRKDQPSGLEISVSSGEICITDGSVNHSFSETLKNDTYTIYNVTPSEDGGTYILTNNGELKSGGRIVPTGLLKMLKIGNSAFNIRDLGGWNCDGGTVKYGKIIRGAELNGTGYHIVITEDDKKIFLEQLGIRADIDLRNDSEILGLTKSALGSSVMWEHYPITPYADGVNIENMGLQYKPLLKSLISHVIANEPCYIHCVGGADRTGTICAIVEALLGVSQSDIDKDYELTSFVNNLHSGETVTRRRSDSVWTEFISYINTMQGNSFRDKVVNWAQKIGLTIDEINDFRNAMIDGEPAALISQVGICAISNNLTKVKNDNTIGSIAEYQPYTAEIKPEIPQGWCIKDVTVKMGGVNITENVWKGNKTKRNVYLNTALEHCSISSANKIIIEGQSYAATVSALDGYTLEGATVSIKMGGVEMSGTYYRDGIIAIPKVTGDVEISITAVPSALPYINQLLASTDINGEIYNGKGFKENTAFSAVGADQTKAGINATGFMPIPTAAVRALGEVVIYVVNSGLLLDTSTRIVLYDNAKNFIGIAYGDKFVTTEQPALDTTKTYVETNDSGAIVKIDPSILCYYYRTRSDSPVTPVYVRICGVGITGDTIITINEEIN